MKGLILVKLSSDKLTKKEVIERIKKINKKDIKLSYASYEYKNPLVV